MACIGKRKGTNKLRFWLGDNLEYVGIILKWILKKWEGKARYGLLGLRLGTNCGQL